MSILEELKERGLVKQVTDQDAIESALNAGPVTVYCGFDPTASSLHAGSLLPIMALARLQRAGHRPIVVLGGATGRIGDPSGRDTERTLQTEDEIEANIAGIRSQLERFVSFDGDNAALMVNNHDWIAPMSYIEWLRDVGKYFSVNAMIAKESVRRRLSEREQGISYTEFSYMLLQAFDFLALFDRHGCTLQVGGSDQWGNITAGIDLIHKKRGKSAYGITFPLLMSASGEKFGKSAGNAVWLDPEMTSPYEFFQYWMRSDDRDVARYMKLFLFRPLDEINAIIAEHEENPGRRKAHTVLARDLTEIVHGPEGLAAAERATSVFFGGTLEDVSERDLGAIFADVPSVTVPATDLESGIPFVDLLVLAGASQSKGKARKLVEQGGAYLNNVREQDISRVVTGDDLATESTIVLRTGRKNYRLVRIQD